MVLNILATEFRIVIGLLISEDLSSPLHIEIKLALFHSEGKIHSLRESDSLYKSNDTGTK